MNTNTELIKIRRQLKLLFACVVFLTVFCIVIAFARFPASRDEAGGWPNRNIGILHVKAIVLTTQTGKKVGVIGTGGEAPFINLLNEKEESRLTLGVSDDKPFENFAGQTTASMTLTNGLISLGDQKSGHLVVEGPPYGGPNLLLQDATGFGTLIGQGTVPDLSDNSARVTSPASLTGFSKNRASTFNLLVEPHPAEQKAHP